jgi:hypothetical protein
MLRHLLSLLLLTILSVGLFAGPHPCKAAHQERQSRQSCHEAAGASHGTAAHKDAPSHKDDGQDCCNTFCQHACQMTAIAGASQVAFAVTPISLAVVEPSGSDLPLFAHPIDHVPLA